MSTSTIESSSRSDEHSTYVTTDLSLASFLASRGFSPIRVEPPEGNRSPQGAACFGERTTRLSEAVIDWTTNSPLSADLRCFLEKRRELLRWSRSVARGGVR